MRVRITRSWRLQDFPFVSLAVGKIFEVRTSLAASLFAMHCAEPAPLGQRAPPSTWTTRKRRKLQAGPWPARTKQPSRIWQYLSERSIAETRIRVAGQWHRLRLELDAALMDQCSFYEADGQRTPAV